MRRAAFLCALLLCLSLCGCHGSRRLDAFVMPESFDTSRDYTITFWAKNDTNKTQTAIYEKAIADFRTLYPNITVSLKLYTDYGRIYNDVITNLSTGTAPNVCITYPDHIATYLTGDNTVVPLDGLLSDAAYGLSGTALLYDAPGAVIPQHLSECVLDGQTYALPFMRSTEACYVNKTLVEKLGYTLPDTLTWDFIWEVSEAAAVRDADGTYPSNGQKVMLPFIYKSTDNMMITYLAQAGAGYSTPDGEIELFNDTARELLHTVAEHAATKAFSTFKISGYPANFLNAGQCVFAIDSTAGATWMGSDAPLIDISADKLVRFETAVMTVPQLDPQNPRMISQGPSVCVFNKRDPQEVLAAWLFAQYLLTEPVQIAYAQTEGYVPVTEKARASDVYLDYLSRAGEDNTTHYAVKIQASRLLLDHTADTFVTPVWNGSASLRDAAGQLIEHVTKSVNRRQTVDDAYIDTLYEDMVSLYHLDQVGHTDASAVHVSGEPLPDAAVILLCSLAGVWVLIAAYYVRRALRRKKQENQ